RRIWARPRTQERDAQRGPAAQGFIVKRALRRSWLAWGALGAGAATALVLLGGALAGWFERAGAAPPAAPVASASFSPAETLSGDTTLARVAWPRLDVASRVRPAEVDPSQPPFRPRFDVPPVGWRLSPGPLAAGLGAAAVLLLLGAVALVGLELRERLVPPELRLLRLRARRSPLEQALELVRDTSAGTPDERRKALEHL